MLGDSVRRRQPGKGKGRAKVTSSPAPRRRRAKRSRKFWLVGIPLALLLPFGIGYVVAVYVLFPPTEVSGMGIPVPDLVGQSTQEAQRALAAAGLGAIEPTELPHPSAASGMVVAQSPLPGQQLRGGGTVRVAVSAGRPRVVIPDVAGFAAERATSLLQRAGFTVTQATQESEVAMGRVLRTEPQPGSAMTLPATVTMIVSSGPPPMAEPEPLPVVPPDTFPPPVR